MVVFADKAAFTALGLEAITPSPTHFLQDCYICTHPLEVTAPSTSTTFALAHSTTHTQRPHAAVRIISCSHVHGAQCLDAWLEVSNTCPSCKRLLFDQTPRAEITQADVRAVLYSLAPLYGIEEVLMAVHRCVSREGGALLQEKLARERREWEEKMMLQEDAVGNGVCLESDEDDMDFEYEDEGEEGEVVDYTKEGSEIAQDGSETSAGANA